jgi:hypothetical protein
LHIIKSIYQVEISGYLYPDCTQFSCFILLSTVSVEIKHAGFFFQVRLNGEFCRLVG